MFTLSSLVRLRLPGNLRLLGILTFLATWQVALADTVAIKAVLVGHADRPQNIVGLQPAGPMPSNPATQNPGVSHVTIEGCVLLWETAGTGISNAPGTILLDFTTSYSLNLATGQVIPSVLPFLSDVRCDRRFVP